MKDDLHQRAPLPYEGKEPPSEARFEAYKLQKESMLSEAFFGVTSKDAFEQLKINERVAQLRDAISDSAGQELTLVDPEEVRGAAKFSCGLDEALDKEITRQEAHQTPAERRLETLAELSRSAQELEFLIALLPEVERITEALSLRGTVLKDHACKMERLHEKLLETGIHELIENGLKGREKLPVRTWKLKAERLEEFEQLVEKAQENASRSQFDPELHTAECLRSYLERFREKVGDNPEMAKDLIREAKYSDDRINNETRALEVLEHRRAISVGEGLAEFSDPDKRASAAVLRFVAAFAR